MTSQKDPSNSHFSRGDTLAVVRKKLADHFKVAAAAVHLIVNGNEVKAEFRTIRELALDKQKIFFYLVEISSCEIRNFHFCFFSFFSFFLFVER